jgi:hypothetical protein
MCLVIITSSSLDYISNCFWVGPPITAVGLGLSIPLAFAADLLLRFKETHGSFVFDWYSGLGAVACLIGFLFVNLDQSDAKEGKDHKDDGHQAYAGHMEFVEAHVDFQKLEQLRSYDESSDVRII